MSDFDNERMNRFLQRVKGMKAEETYQSRKTALNRFDKWLATTDQSPEQIGPLEIEDFLAHLASEGYAPTTIATYYDGVRLFYKFLARDGVIEENPADDVDRNNIRSITKGTRKENEAEVIYVTEGEKEAMVEHAPSPRLRNRLVLRLFWQTGVRIHELVGIKLEHIDQEQRSIRIYSSKTDDWRTVYFQESLDFLLNQWVGGGYRDAYAPTDQSPYLFPSDQSDQITTTTIGKMVLEAAKNAGCQEQMYTDAGGQPKWRVTAHSLRHGHAVHALKSGIDIRTLQKHLGHQNLSTTQQYLSILDDDVKRAYRQFGEANTK